jgi:hypothetical protein
MRPKVSYFRFMAMLVGLVRGLLAGVGRAAQAVAQHAGGLATLVW